MNTFEINGTALRDGWGGADRFWFSQKRKARLTIWSPHPLQHTDDSNISIVKGYKNYYLFQMTYSHRDVFFVSFKLFLSYIPKHYSFILEEDF